MGPVPMEIKGKGESHLQSQSLEVLGNNVFMGHFRILS